ncbi:MAG: ATP-binding protein [Chitinophagales bacterium]
MKKGSFYIVLMFLMASCTTPENKAIDLNSIETLQSVYHNFEYYIDESDQFDLNALDYSNLENLNYSEAKSDIISNPCHLIVVKVVFDNQIYESENTGPVIFELGYPFLHHVKASIKTKDGDWVMMDEAEQIAFYDRRHFIFNSIVDKTEVHSAYFILDSYALPVFVNLFVWDTAFYDNSIKSASKYGFLFGIYGILFIILMILVLLHKDELFIATACFVSANLFYFLINGGWVRAFFLNFPQLDIWIEIATYSIKFFVSFSGFYIIAAIYKQYIFGVTYLVINWIFIAITWLLFLLELIVAFFFSTSEFVIVLNQFIYWYIVVIVIYASWALIFVYYKTKESIYLSMAVVPSIHILGYLLLVLRSLNIIPLPLNYYFGQPFLEFFPTIHYHPAILDVGMFIEIIGITLVVFATVQTSVILNYKIKHAYATMSTDLTFKLMRVEKLERNYFKKIIDEKVLTRLDSFRKTLKKYNIEDKDETLKTDIDKLYEDLASLDPNYGLDTENASSKLLLLFDKLQVAHPDILFKIRKESLFNLLPINSKRNIYGIIQTAVNNAIYHAKCNLIRLSFQVEKGHLIMRFIDNGKGFSLQDLKTSGNGIINMEYRVNLMKGEIKIISKRSIGTTIWVKVPING